MDYLESSPKIGLKLQKKLKEYSINHKNDSQGSKLSRKLQQENNIETNPKQENRRKSCFSILNIQNFIELINNERFSETNKLLETDKDTTNQESLHLIILKKFSFFIKKILRTRISKLSLNHFESYKMDQKFFKRTFYEILLNSIKLSNYNKDESNLIRELEENKKSLDISLGEVYLKFFLTSDVYKSFISHYGEIKGKDHSLVLRKECENLVDFYNFKRPRVPKKKFTCLN